MSTQADYQAIMAERAAIMRFALANHLVDLDMLVWTEGQQYSEAELRAAPSRASRSPHEREPGIPPMDATDRGARAPRSRG